jgi:DNA polymerase delta subunit 4
MPTTRRSSSGPKSGAAGGKQATLSFHNRVTKSVPKSSKDLISSTTPTKGSPLRKQVSRLPDDELEIEEPEEETPPIVEKSEAELRAEKISDRQISAYWKNVESQRSTKRVHQKDLGLAEKVLRYFDVSNQYGVSITSAALVCWPVPKEIALV